jgi:hypothetical protein
MLANEESPDPNKQIALNLNLERDFATDFFASRWEENSPTPSLQDCKYNSKSQLATIHRAGRLSFRKFFGYSNDIKYDALYAGKLSNIYTN